jgi:hypothetical protein
MANTVSAQIGVYSSTVGGITTYQFLPSSYAVAQGRTIVAVTLTAIASPNNDPPPVFGSNSISQTTSGTGTVVLSQQSQTAFSCMIDNSNSDNPTGVRFAGPANYKIPPFVIDGGGTIRDKGTSIFKLVASAVLGLVIGWVLGAKLMM